MNIVYEGNVWLDHGLCEFRVLDSSAGRILQVKEYTDAGPDKWWQAGPGELEKIYLAIASKKWLDSV